MAEVALTFGTEELKRSSEEGPTRTPLFVAPLAMLVAVAVGTFTYELIRSRLWSELASIALYVASTVIIIGLARFRLRRSVRVYLAGVVILAALLTFFVWFWLGSEVELAWLGEASEDIMKYVGVWLTGADGPLAVSLTVWFLSFLFFSVIGYFLGEALYDARH